MGDVIYVLSKEGALWREREHMSDRDLVDQNVGAFQAIDTTLVYVLSKQGALWRERGSGTDRDLVDENVGAFQAIDSSLVYVLSKQGALWQERGNSANRDLVDENVGAFQAIDNHLVYVLSKEGALWRERSNRGDRDLVDENVGAFQAIDNHLVYVLSKQGALWRERGSGTDRDLVDENVGAFQAIDSSLVYVLSKQGALWRERGNSANRDLVDENVGAFQVVQPAPGAEDPRAQNTMQEGISNRIELREPSGRLRIAWLTNTDYHDHILYPTTDDPIWEVRDREDGGPLDRSKWLTVMTRDDGPYLVRAHCEYQNIPIPRYGGKYIACWFEHKRWDGANHKNDRDDPDCRIMTFLDWDGTPWLATILEVSPPFPGQPKFRLKKL